MSRKKRTKLDTFKHTKNPRTRVELLDCDYLNKLSTKELEWYAKFTEEYVHASIKRDKKGNPVKSSIHKKKEFVKDSYDRNNKRNNDLYSVTRSNGLLYDVNDSLSGKDGWYITNADLTEEALIAQIDSGQQYEELDYYEYVLSRNNFPEERQKELDLHFMKTLNIKSENYYLLLIIHNAKLVKRRKFLKLSMDEDKLKKFVQNSEFFKEEGKRAKSSYRTNHKFNR